MAQVRMRQGIAKKQARKSLNRNTADKRVTAQQRLSRRKARRSRSDPHAMAEASPTYDSCKA
jgi:hypothetical protein